MKKISVILASILVITACGGSKESPETPGGGGGGGGTTPPTITIGTGVNTNPVIDAAGGKAEVSFTASDAWTASVINTRADSWVSVSPTSGAKGSAKITIEAKSNDTPNERGATIQIKSGSATKNITLTQKQKDSFTASASKTELGKDGGNFTIEVKANIDFTYTIDSGSDWIKYLSTKALKTSTLTFSADKNEELTRREGQITVSSNVGKEIFKIYQEGASPTIILTSNTVNVPQAGGTVQVEVKSNVDVAVSIQDGITWVSEIGSKAMSTNTWNFTVEENGTNDNRTAEIYFTNKANNLSEKVQIVQAQKNAIVIAKDHYDMNADGGNFTVTVQHNVDFNVEISDSWITRASGTKAMTSDDIVFNVAKNETGDTRTGTVRFKAGDIVQTVTVIQAQNDALVIAKNRYDIPVEGGTFDVTLNRNVDYQVSINVDWITRQTGTKAMVSETVAFKVAENTSNDSRTGIITFKAGSIEQKVTVIQAQKNAIVIAQSTYDVKSSGGNLEVSVSHNVDFDVNVDVDWIAVPASTKAMTTDVLTFVVAANTTEEARSGKITFTAGSLVQNITINQAAPVPPTQPGIYGINGIEYEFNEETDQLVISTRNYQKTYWIITPSTNKFLSIKTNDDVFMEWDHYSDSEIKSVINELIDEGWETSISITQNTDKSAPALSDDIRVKVTKYSGNCLWLKDENNKTAIIKIK